MSGVQSGTEGAVPLVARATRMLLSSDGSTTLLLEALLDTRLAVHVEDQSTVPVGQLPPTAVTALGLRPGAAAVRRASALLTPEGAVVSRNTVVFTAPPGGWSGSASDAAPLGKRLRQHGTRQHREILSSGAAVWPDHGERRCAYKEYVITCDDSARLYVREHFSPEYVHLPDGSPGFDPAGAGDLDPLRRAG
ncbi:hypothetical protein [Streptomyces olivaceiscleroticus]|uniref:Chorismate lyase n=1 Tax=Streptomyces olivaceiscleroticus TaxID=68245 RepID=A0ABN1B0B4_9ACTN